MARPEVESTSVRGRIRPAPWTSALALFVGLIMFVAFASSGSVEAGGGVFLIVLLAVLVYHGINLFTRRGIAHEVVDIEPSVGGGSRVDRLEEELKDLERLRRNGSLNEDEFRRKRRELLDRPL